MTTLRVDRRLRLLSCLVAALTSVAGCHSTPPDFYSGYVEADYVRLASPLGGTLAHLFVQRGQQVAAGAPAFALEQESEQAARRQAQAQLQRAHSALANLQKGRRPDELAVIDAQLAQGEAALKLSQAELARQTRLQASNFVAPARVDEARAALAKDGARVRELQAQKRVAKLGARSDEIGAAADEVKAAEAELAQADWRLAQKAVKLPLAAQVDDVLYREGEMVQAGAPVLTLLAPEHVRARFFVPQAQLGALAIGQDVTLSCDGCKAPIAAKISFIARDAEYTSPLIYSKENRATLVFMVEARSATEAARQLHPGQPLEVRLAGAPAPRP
ncbi:MAG: HlyD family efflux transporter periplasmic adaptor subunit [Pseudomonadota bacterium]